MTTNSITYKGYVAQLELDLEDEIIVGHVTNSAAIISFHGKTIAEAKQTFNDALDSYLEIAQQEGIQHLEA
jgi:predicted HicB family RNase H-like nuclease